MPKSKTICSAPFNQVCVTATGRYALCCNAVANYSFPCEERHINQMKNVNDWFEGTYMKNIRKAMIKGKKLKEWFYNIEKYIEHVRFVVKKERQPDNLRYAVGKDEISRFLNIRWRI